MPMNMRDHHDTTARLMLWEARRSLRDARFHMSCSPPSHETLGAIDELEELLKSMRPKLIEAA